MIMKSGKILLHDIYSMRFHRIVNDIFLRKDYNHKECTGHKWVCVVKWSEVFAMNCGLYHPDRRPDSGF